MRAFRNATMASFPNRAGGPGIEVHFDVPGTPVRPDVTIPVNDPNIGVWGGATCVRPPSCVSDADCNFGSDTTGACGLPNPVSLERHCTNYDERAVNMSASRRWLFHRSVQLGRDEETPTSFRAFGGGQTVDFRPVTHGGGLAFVGTQHYSNRPAAILHELGHHAGLHHNGPAPLDGGGSDFNYRPNYYSRMNYAYSYFGDIQTPGLSGAGAVPVGELRPVDNSDWDRVSFSGGTTPTLDPLRVPERAVFTSPLFDPVPFEASPFVNGTIGGPLRWDVTATGGVDWDRSGAPLLPFGQTEEARLFLFQARMRRAPPASRPRWFLLDSPSDLVIQGSAAWLFRAVWEQANLPRAMTVSVSPPMYAFTG